MWISRDKYEELDLRIRRLENAQCVLATAEGSAFEVPGGNKFKFNFYPGSFYPGQTVWNVNTVLIAIIKHLGLRLTCTPPRESELSLETRDTI